MRSVDPNEIGRLFEPRPTCRRQGERRRLFQEVAVECRSGNDRRLGIERRVSGTREPSESMDV